MHEQIQAVFKDTLVDTLGIRFIEASKERVVAEMTVKPSLFTSNGRLHGGRSWRWPIRSGRPARS